jgi:hypothetical protein
MTPLSSKPRVFGIDYQFLSCGNVFTQGLVHAAADLGIEYVHADWSEPRLNDRIAQFAPDLMFLVHGRRFAYQWRQVARSAVWLLDEPYEVDDTSAWSGRFDHVFISDPVTAHRHQHATYLPVCYDPHVHQSSDGPRPHAVGFIGGGNGTRDRYLTGLARAGLLSYVVGGAWNDPDVNRLCLAGNIQPSQTAALYQQTRIVLNVFREVHHFNRDGIPATSLNPRVYEALACGALVVSEWRPEVDRVVPELPTFRSEQECIDLIAGLIAEPDRAEAIRLQCAARLKDHTYANRLQTVLATVGSAVAA